MSIGLASADGRVRAAVDLVGGGLQALSVDGCDIVEGYDQGPPPHAAGAVLFPWPNRVRDGRWTHRGVERQLEVSEPGLNNANHGLVCENVFRVAGQEPQGVCLSTDVVASQGYPFDLTLTLTYEVLADGVLVQACVENHSLETAPLGLGFHPYLRIGDVPTAELMLDVRAGFVLDLDEQLIPVGQHPVSGTPESPAGMPLAGARLNHCYGGLTPGASHRLKAPDGRQVELRTDSRFGWVQIYTCPNFPRGMDTVTAVAVEPMTAPPDALRSGRDLAWVEPGHSWSAGWSLHLNHWLGRPESD
ncbi:hypothetical protein LWF15_08555 [Kineosporia rhizophila]|uniref:aldose epimerase family protein n=1 Tax=Kineosporia TaxID=49184 RepID=UPI001E63671F|nr:hypothetical protein [Kineosporia sp. NBRC 101677]MCE0535559.1 hypothetical protein [Kineosporia rhizophila]GLY16646.1 aldose 1-epimerase [Kineosporia sp. NBRC 101677]